LLALGEPESLLRHITLGLYIVFLITMILTVVPVSAVIKSVASIFTRKRIARQHVYFSAPSGEDRSQMEHFRDD
jgi:hypothetical protein